MTTTRRRIRLISPVLALALATAHVAAAAPAEHLACASAHHGCGTTLTIGPCCCGGDSQASGSMAPPPSRARVSASLPDAAVDQPLPRGTAGSDPTPLPRVRVMARDLPVLLANLRL